MNCMRRRFPRGSTRGFTLIEFIALLAIIAILSLVVLLPAVPRGYHGGGKTADATNLKRLVETWLSGQAQRTPKQTPTSVGHRFWLALCVGDGPGEGNLTLQGSDDPNQYIGSGDGAGLFLSPGDRDCLNQDEVKQELENVLQAGTGVAGLQNSDLMCSYAGPSNPAVDMRNKKGLIVGCTIDRAGMSIFDDGFNGVTASAQARYYNYRDMVDQYNWPDGVSCPQYGLDPLTNVVR